MKAIKLCLLLCCVASLSWGQVRITEVNTTSGDITLTNMGGSVEDVSSWWLCNFPAYDEISSLPLVSGSTMLMAGTSLTITWGDAVAADGECALYNTNSFTSSAAIEDYMQWASGGHTRENVAVSAGVWCAGEFVAGTSPYSFTGGSSDFCSAFWTDAVVPGCTNSIYDNYNPSATEDDGSCGWDISFSVDMNNYVSAFGYVNISGAWNSWCGDCNQLTDADLDGVWEGTFPIPDGNYRFKYSVDNWADSEPLGSGASWTCTVQEGDFINRDMSVAGAGYAISTVCWNSCQACAGSGTPGCTDASAQNYDSTATESNGTCEYLVTFQLNMVNYPGTFTATEVNGIFNGWCGNCNAMVDADLDNIWEVQAPITEGWYEYKFSLDSWSDQESLTPGDPCVVTNFGNTNRNVQVTADVVLPTVCWHSCDDCVANAGCTDSTANNYDSSANTDDGSCTYDVTFSVDMNNVVDVFTTPEVNGSFNSWCGGCAPMSDPELDGVWELTISLGSGSHEYKFAADGWAIQEDLTEGDPCTVNGAPYVNRLINVSGPEALATVCYNSCDACPVGSSGCTDSTANNYDSSASSDDGSCTYDVTFSVDMNNVVDVFTTPEVNGSFNSWCGGCAPMSDPELDGVWELTISLGSGSHEYKFAADGWAIQEDLTEGDPCTVNGAPFVNRLINVSGQETLAVVCWGSCSACVANAGCTDSTANNYDSSASSDDGSCTYDVIFTVDMNNYGIAGVDYTTPEVNGGFNGWCGGCAPMSDPELDGVWTVTISLPAGNQEYKFAVDSWADQEYPDASEPCMLGANRLVVVSTATDIGVVCWGSCSACVANAGCTDSTANNYNSTAVTDDGSCLYDVTFTVDMNNYGTAGVDYITPEVNGGFNGWCGGCNPLVDPELDGVWTTTLPLLAGSYDYQFAIDAWTDQEFGLDPAASCTNGGNRFVNVSGPTDQGLVCWESCSACVANAGCTDSTANNYDSSAVTDDGSCTYDVTFSVDMNSFGGGFTGVSVFATFNGWDVNANPLTDADLDGVWEVTLSLLNGAHEFKYAVDGPPGQEAFTGTEPCVVGADPYWNRSLNVSGDETLATVCYNSCDACPVGSSGCTDSTANNYDSSASSDDGSCTYDVTFSVDMNNVVDVFTTPEVNGSFNSWCGGCAPMSDPELDGVWELTISLGSGSHEYKFAADGWAIQEDLTEGDPCTVNGAPFVNRLINVSGQETLAVVCWGSCSACVANAGCTDSTANNYDSSASSDDGSCTYDVIFTVDMNNYGIAGVDYTTPEVNGGFNGWCGGCAPMSDPELDGVWTVTISLPAGNQEYKFAVDSWADQEYPDASEPCMLGANRLVVVSTATDIGVVCWGSCSACVANAGCTDSTANNYDSSASSDDGSCTYDVIFTVDMNNYGIAGVDYTTPEVNGGFNSWCGGCAPMSDPELDGVWTVTISLPAGNQEYKFAVDSWADQEYPDASEPCMLGANRLVVVSTATDIGVVCWGSCSACPTSGCTDPAYTEFDPYAGIDDGSCATLVVEGCAYAAAINYDSMANTDDGSCLFDCTDPCPGDFDDNLVINTADLLSFLTFFGTTCD